MDSRLPSFNPQWMTDLQVLLASSFMTEVDAVARERCVDVVREGVQKTGLAWQVQAFGSCVTGFATENSDLDVTCYRKDAQPGSAMEELMNQLRPTLLATKDLHGRSRFDIVAEVFGAKIPILKLKFDQSVEVDISCHNQQALQNTHLLKSYADMHPVIRQLVVVVKKWAKCQEMCDASDGHLSSYAWTLMVLYYLQTIYQLPCLPTKLFDGEEPPNMTQTWSCSDPLDILLCHFFRFYSVHFKWGYEVVSVRQGTRSRMTEVQFRDLPGRGVARIHIEDPFLLGRNLNCTLGVGRELRMKRKFHEVWYNVQRQERFAFFKSQDFMCKSAQEFHQVTPSRFRGRNVEVMMRQDPCKRVQKKQSNKQCNKYTATESGSNMQCNKCSNTESESTVSGGDSPRSFKSSEEEMAQCGAATRQSTAALWLGPELHHGVVQFQ